MGTQRIPIPDCIGNDFSAIGQILEGGSILHRDSSAGAARQRINCTCLPSISFLKLRACKAKSYCRWLPMGEVQESSRLRAESSLAGRLADRADGKNAIQAFDSAAQTCVDLPSLVRFFVSCTSKLSDLSVCIRNGLVLVMCQLTFDT